MQKPQQQQQQATVDLSVYDFSEQKLSETPPPTKFPRSPTKSSSQERKSSKAAVVAAQTSSKAPAGSSTNKPSSKGVPTQGCHSLIMDKKNTDILAVIIHSRAC